MRTLFFIALALAALCFALWQRARTRRTLRRLDEILAQAADGGFTAERFDETRLSALEARFAQYLSASACSARRVREEKDAVKTLIGDVAHQTRTPLANIRLYTQLLAEQPLNDQDRACAAALDAQTEKLQSLLEALVKTSRLETGALALVLTLAAAPAMRSALEELFWFLTYRFTLWPVLAAAPVFAALGIAIPALCSRREAKRSIVERLRQE